MKNPERVLEVIEEVSKAVVKNYTVGDDYAEGILAELNILKFLVFSELERQKGENAL